VLPNLSVLLHPGTGDGADVLVRVRGYGPLIELQVRNVFIERERETDRGLEYEISIVTGYHTIIPEQWSRA
jgi:hypothetical protein